MLSIQPQPPRGSTILNSLGEVRRRAKSLIPIHRPTPLDVDQAVGVSQSVSHYHTPTRKELTAYTYTLLWSSFKCAAGFSASFSLFWKVVVLQDGLLLLSLFTYLLAGADLVESGPFTCAGETSQ
eukprot:scaffold2746_cov63-Phaeocystis_antarctica.AAC.1